MLAIRPSTIVAAMAVVLTISLQSTACAEKNDKPKCIQQGADPSSKQSVRCEEPDGILQPAQKGNGVSKNPAQGSGGIPEGNDAQNLFVYRNCVANGAANHLSSDAIKKKCESLKGINN